ncbi:tetratricopeptide repeat protein [Flavobacterium sp. AS60]|uniref:tetratricopeptide repeat-containing sensor histidine kinase n=1 Tax=Flavobacterium anseongense TaxID=2910677 RepID=UPI001F28DDFE|nr:tetratricopeptide repeat protein [Flavobacterium sp. AS60]MCF6128573.1 tetratricopeptide repeat protein [Flavobacterium sp. AS60]
MDRLHSYWFIILLVSLYGCTSKTVDKDAQARNDSIQKYLDLAGNDSLDTKLRNKYNAKAFSLVDLSKNDTLTRFYLSSISFNYLGVKNWDDLNTTGKILFEKSKTAKDTLNLARYYRYKAGYFMKNKIYDSAYYYYIKAEKFYKRTNDYYSLAKIYQYKSLIQFSKDDYLGTDLSAEKALDYFKTTNHREDQFLLLLYIGNSAHNLKNYKKAINSFNLALSIAKKYNLKKSSDNRIAACLNNIGNAYREQKKYSQAMQYFNLALKQRNLIKEDPVAYGFLLNNLSYCKLQLKDYSEFPFLLFKSIDLLNNSEEGIKESTISYVYLSNYYNVIKDSLKAQLYAEKALKNAKKVNSPYYYLTALSNAGCVNNKKAPQYIKEYHEKNDSLLFIERNARNQYYKIQHETDEITQEKETAIKQKWIIGIIAGAVILIIVLLLIITRQSSKQKDLQFQQSQQKANEEIYDLMLTQKRKEEQARQSEKKRIAIDLHDGVMNRLASTRLNLNVLLHQKDEETIKKCLNYIDDIYNIEQEIRNIAHDLNTEIFNQANSFAVLLNDFITTQNTITNSQYILEADKAIDWNSIASGIKMNLYRIIQEASNNINKYARASNVVINLIMVENNICLSITDNGKGFDVDANVEGMGLKNIKDRVESLKGKVVFQSNTKNTSINITIPHTI